MPDSLRPQRTPGERADMKRWLDSWALASERLEQERWERLALMTAEECRVATRQVWELWRPDWPTDEGEGLLLQQRVFARARRRR